MVRPQLEYASEVWDPHYVGDMELEKVYMQWRAACWVLNDDGRFSSVTSMLDQLSRPTLQIRRKISRLHICIHCTKFSYHQLSQYLILTCYTINKTVSPTALHLIPYSSTRAHQNSYFSRTISDRNLLPVATSYWNYRYWHV